MRIAIDLGLVQNKFLNGQFLKASLRRFFNFAENIKQELISFTTLIELGIYLPTRVEEGEHRKKNERVKFVYESFLIAFVLQDKFSLRVSLAFTCDFLFFFPHFSFFAFVLFSFFFFDVLWLQLCRLAVVVFFVVWMRYGHDTDWQYALPSPTLGPELEEHTTDKLK